MRTGVCGEIFDVCFIIVLCRTERARRRRRKMPVMLAFIHSTCIGRAQMRTIVGVQLPRCTGESARRAYSMPMYMCRTIRVRKKIVAKSCV